MASIVLKTGRERSVLRRHPWIFSNAIARVEGHAGAGDTVEILGPDGTLRGHGAYAPGSQIAVRVWSFDPEERVAGDLIRSRLARARAARSGLRKDGRTTALRLVNAESDGLPGVSVDLYGEQLVCQLTSAGAERFREEIADGLRELEPAAGIFERSDAPVRRKEGLTPRTGVLAGREPPELIEVTEGGCRYLVDVRRGHKTGFYIDQRENRAALAELAAGAEILNGFAYTGAFGIAALAGGASRVTNVESSAEALGLASRHVTLNGLDPARVENVQGDAFQVLREYRQAGRRFDLVVLDPPRFVESKAQLPRASRGYKDINLLAFQLLRPGGLLLTFSCSGLMPPDLFQKIVADAALDAGREAQILRRLGQAADHPVALSFPEGSYLKGLVCRAW